MHAHYFVRLPTQLEPELSVQGPYLLLTVSRPLAMFLSYKFLAPVFAALGRDAISSPPISGCRQPIYDEQAVARVTTMSLSWMIC